MDLNINNLFEHCDKSLCVNDVLTCVYDKDFYYTIISVNYDDKINYYSNDWLCLLNFYYPYFGEYTRITNHSNEIIKNKLELPKIFIDHDVLQIFNSFSKGTVHGFSSFYYTIIEYFNNYEKYKNLKLIILRDSEKGMLDIINHLCESGLLDINNIIYIELNSLYLFKSVTFIPNKYHCFNNEFIPIVDKFIESSLIIKDSSIYTNPNICLLKSDNSNNIGTSSSNLTGDMVENFCNKWDFKKCSGVNEIDRINYIYNCKVLVISYGSAFFKNFIYVSDICEKIIVIVSGDIYVNDYNRLANKVTTEYEGVILKKYKNADVFYTIRNDLDFDPFSITQ